MSDKIIGKSSVEKPRVGTSSTWAVNKYTHKKAQTANRKGLLGVWNNYFPVICKVGKKTRMGNAADFLKEFNKWS